MTDALAFHSVAELVLTCACAQMDALAADPPVGLEYPGCPCRQYVSPGPPAWEACCDHCGDDVGGQLTVHVVDAFEFIEFPNRSTIVHPCRGTRWAVDLIVTVVRCGPQMDESGRDPSADSLTTAAEVGHADLWAIMQALSCCVVDDAPFGRRKRSVLITGMRPVGEQGGCVGFEVAATVEVGGVCTCVESS